MNNDNSKLYDLITDNYKIADDEMESLQARFRKIHLLSHLTATFFTLIFDLLFLVTDRGVLFFLQNTHWMEFILLPFLFNIALYFAAKNMNERVENSIIKNYIVMTSSIIQSFIFVASHQFLTAINATFVVLILLSTIYDNRSLTRYTVFLSYLSILISILIRYDGSRFLADEHIPDFLAIIFIIIFTQVTAMRIIRVNNDKKTKILDAIQEKDEYWHGMMKDDLSGLNSRSALRIYLDKLISYNGDISVVMIDLDHFKKINDSFGHQYGDDVIKILGKSINAYIYVYMQKDKNDEFVAFRYGGEEFLCIIKKDVNRTHAIIEEIKSVFNKSCYEKLSNPNISFSAGISKVNESKKIADVIKEADVALYRAKEGGRNRIVIYEEKKTERESVGLPDKFADKEMR